jgi:opacity protein-like surface antigen
MKRNVLLLTLALCAMTAPVAMAQSDIGFKAIGGAVGFVSPENMDGTFSIGALADLGTITPDIGLEAHLDYWSWSETAFGVEATARDITLGARGKYYFEVANSKIRPFAGAGLAFHFIRAEVTTPPFGGQPAETVSDSQTKLGLDLGGGLATPINPRVDFLGELWYGIVSDVSQFSLRAGLAFKVGK